MAEPRQPGRRPWGFWRFEQELAPAAGRDFLWPAGIAGEAHMVWQHHAGPVERAQIEAEWLKAVRVAAASCARDHVECARDLYGVPRDFARQHLSAAVAQLKSEQRAFRRQRD